MCRRWRDVMFASTQRRLDLRLLYTNQPLHRSLEDGATLSSTLVFLVRSFAKDNRSSIVPAKTSPRWCVCTGAQRYFPHPSTAVCGCLQCVASCKASCFACAIQPSAIIPRHQLVFPRTSADNRSEGRKWVKMANGMSAHSAMIGSDESGYEAGELFVL